MHSLPVGINFYSLCLRKHETNSKLWCTRIYLTVTESVVNFYYGHFIITPKYKKKKNIYFMVGL